MWNRSGQLYNQSSCWFSMQWTASFCLLNRIIIKRNICMHCLIDAFFSSSSSSLHSFLLFWNKQVIEKQREQYSFDVLLDCFWKWKILRKNFISNVKIIFYDLNNMKMIDWVQRLAVRVFILVKIFDMLWIIFSVISIEIVRKPSNDFLMNQIPMRFFSLLLISWHVMMIGKCEDFFSNGWFDQLF